MIAELYKPFHISPQDLDNFLASGGTRDGGYLNRLEIVYYDHQLCTIVPLRINLKDFEFSKSQRKLIRKNDQKYPLTIQSAIINKEKEALYQQHKVRFKDFQSDSILWFFESPIDGFKLPIDTQELILRNDQGEMIACSFFDKGKTSMYSILGLYDQSYHKDSLGIYTILKEIEHAKKVGLSYYYIGYVFDLPSLFDYKLKFKNLEAYLWDKDQWKSWEKANLSKTLGQLIRTKSDELVKIVAPVFPDIKPHFNGRFFFDYLINDAEHIISLPFLFYFKLKIGRVPHQYALGFDHYKKLFWIAFQERIAEIEYFDSAKELLGYLKAKESFLKTTERITSEKVEHLFSKIENVQVQKEYNPSEDQDFIYYILKSVQKEICLEYHVLDSEFYLYQETDLTDDEPIYIGKDEFELIKSIQDFFNS